MTYSGFCSSQETFFRIFSSGDKSEPIPREVIVRWQQWLKLYWSFFSFNQDTVLVLRRLLSQKQTHEGQIHPRCRSLSLQTEKIFSAPSKQELMEKKAFKLISHFWLLAELLLSSCLPLYPWLRSTIDLFLSFFFRPSMAGSEIT